MPPSNTQESPKRTPKRQRNKLSFEDIMKCFQYKETEAANILGISKTKLKRVCRMYNVPRWPFRRIRSIDRDIKMLEEKMAKCENGVFQKRYLQNKIEHLKQAKEYIFKNPKIVTIQSNEVITEWFEKLHRTKVSNLLNSEEEIGVQQVNNMPLQFPAPIPML